MKSIAVVILNYKGWQDTLECIESLQSQDYENFRIIIVDNNSENGSLEKFREYAEGKIYLQSKYFVHIPKTIKRPYIEYDTETAIKGGTPEQEEFIGGLQTDKGIVIINNAKNLGFSGGNNVGAKYAEKRGYEYVLLLNNDTIIVDKDFLSKLISPFNQNNNIYLVGPKINNFDSTFDSPIIEDTFMGNLLYLPILNMFRKMLNCPSIYIDIKAISSPNPIPVFKISGACMMFKSSRLKEIDYLDENVWLSSEEAIISEKIKQKKGIIVFQPLTILIHKKAQSPRPKSDKYYILKEHYKQREYFNRTYRHYNPIEMGLIKFSTNLRLILIKLIS